MSSSEESDDSSRRDSVPRGTCWICGEPTKNPKAKQHSSCREERHLEKKKKKKKRKKEKKKKKRKQEEAAKMKAAKARKKLAAIKANKANKANKAKKRKHKDEEDAKVPSNKKSKTATTSSPTPTPTPETLKPIEPESIKAEFKVEHYNKVSSPDLQVLDDTNWRYASIHVHKKDSHVIIWYGGYEYEGLGLKKGKQYSIAGLASGELYTGGNAQLLDSDGDKIDCKRGPPKPLPTFNINLYNKLSAERFQVEGTIPGEYRSCSLWQLKAIENQHCKYGVLFFLVMVLKLF